MEANLGLKSIDFLRNFDPFTATAVDIQDRLDQGVVTSAQLIEVYLNEIAKNDGYLRAITSKPPVSLLFKEALRLDEERLKGLVRGPLHGIPDIIDTEPRFEMSTTAGSLALAGTKPKKNAQIVDRLLDAGAIILAKASLSEWAWYRSYNIPSAWCAISGQGQSPYVYGGFKEGDSPSGHSNPAGSSSGSAIGVAAGFAPIAVGVESSGSLTMPACRAALYTIKPTIGIVPGDGVMALTYHSDATGPMAKNAKDVADMLDVMVDRDKTEVPDGGYKSCLTRQWTNIRVGVVKPEEWLLGSPIVVPVEPIDAQIMDGFREAYSILEKHAASFKRVKLVSVGEATANGTKDIRNLAKRDFKILLNEWLQQTPGTKVHSLADVIKFNRDHAEQELPPRCTNQRLLEEVQATDMSDEEYNEILVFGRKKSRDEGIDRTMAENDVNILVGPSDSNLFVLSSLSGYPIAAVPFQNVSYDGNERPYGLFALAKEHHDGLLVEFMSAWEASIPARKPPSFFAGAT